MENRSKYEKSFAHTQTRNIRYLFVVDSEIKIEDLIFLFQSNMRYWGGRYNPIIPSTKGVISKEFLELALFFDPDYVVYSDEKCLSTLEQTFHPIKFVHVPHLSHFNLDGLDESLLLNLSYGYDTVLTESYLYKSLPDLYDFYKLNFGFLDGDNNDSVRKFKQVKIGQQNHDKLDEFLVCGNIFLVSRLSRINVSRPYLKSNAIDLKGIELIVADESKPFNDLIYFWNRELYAQRENYSLNQIYITKKQLELFITNCKIDYFFGSFCGNEGMTVSSQSLDEKELKEITDKLNAFQKRAQPMRMIKRPAFPFKIDGTWINSDYDEPEVKQTLIGRHDLLHLPDLSFISDSRIYGKWAVDIMIERHEAVEQNKILLPQRENLHRMFTDLVGRINRKYAISYIVNRDNKVFDFRIPTDEEISRFLILRPGSDTKNEIDRIETSDDGLRLASLFTVFNNNYSSLRHFFQNEYWLQVFRGKSIVPGDKRMKQCKGVVSYKDLQAEYKNIIERQGFVFDELVYKDDNNELFDDLNSLVELGAFFVGNKLKCKNCGSAHWYGLNDLHLNMECKGCLHKIRVDAEQLPYYKINDVIRNNLLSFSGTGNDIHGNLTVLYTLISLREKSWHGFIAIPQQNYFKRGEKLHSSDIDLVCIADGRLIIGEAKNSVSEFTNKEIDNLIFLGNNIMPDKIILAFNEGDEKKLEPTIKKIREGLNNKSIFVEPYRIPSSFFMSRNERLLKRKSEVE